MKELKSKIFEKAHELTRRFKEKYKDVSYKAQFGEMLRLVYAEIENGILEKEVELFPVFSYKKVAASIVRIQAMESKKSVLQGIVEYASKQYYFVAGKEHAVPVVFGATNMEILIAAKDAIEKQYPKFFEVSIDCFENDPVYNFKRLDEGVFCYSTDNVHFRGYYRTRAFEWNVDAEKYPRTCAFSTLIKDLDRPGKKSFRSMKGAGKKIESEIDFIKDLCNSHYSIEIVKNNNAKTVETKKKEVISKVKTQLKPSMLNRVKKRKDIINKRRENGENMFGERLV